MSLKASILLKQFSCIKGSAQIVFYRPSFACKIFHVELELLHKGHCDYSFLIFVSILSEMERRHQEVGRDNGKRC